MTCMSQFIVAAVLAFLAGGCFLGVRATNGHGPEAGFAGIGLTVLGAVLLLAAALLGIAALF